MKQIRIRPSDLENALKRAEKIDYLGVKFNHIYMNGVSKIQNHIERANEWIVRYAVSYTHLTLPTNREV